MAFRFSNISGGIRVLPLRCIKLLDKSELAYSVGSLRVVRPIDYMRCAEYQAILDGLDIQPGMKILDVSSPQWFSLYLAHCYPDVTFSYMNIIDSELEPYKRIAEVLGIKNILYYKEDVRKLSFRGNYFDRVISISVIEHISPAVGGDLQALQEIRRVLKPNAEIRLTLPYKDKKNIVRVDGAVYERDKEKANFFAREYDEQSLASLIAQSGFLVKERLFISERPGFFALDYYEWGPGKNNICLKYLMKSRRLIEIFLRRSIDEWLARRYLTVSSQPLCRLVHAAATLV